MAPEKESLETEVQRLRQALYDISRANEGAMASHGMNVGEALANVVKHAKEALGTVQLEEERRLCQLAKGSPWVQSEEDHRK